MSDNGQDLSGAGVYGLSTEQATAELNKMTAALHAPASSTPQNANEARARLQALANDTKWYDRYVRGSQAERAEFDQLTRLAASDGEQEAIGLIETVDATQDRDAQPRRAYAALFDGLRGSVGGLPQTAEDAMRAIDSGEMTDRPTEGDRLVAREALERLSKSPEWVKKFLAGDIRANADFNALNRVAAYAMEDGKSVTEPVTKFIDALWERQR
jgi:hypothetical protein